MGHCPSVGRPESLEESLMDRGLAPGGATLLTFESQVTRLAWSDGRSPCQNPFFDPFADSAPRRPLISGLCVVLAA